MTKLFTTYRVLALVVGVLLLIGTLDAILKYGFADGSGFPLADADGDATGPDGVPAARVTAGADAGGSATRARRPPVSVRTSSTAAIRASTVSAGRTSCRTSVRSCAPSRSLRATTAT